MPVRELSSRPNLAVLFAKALATSRTGGEDLPDDELVLRDLAVDRDHLADYNRVCGFGLRDELPLTYPHVLAFPMTVQLMADRRFPFALPGLVHIGNRISQQRALDAAESLTLRVQAAGLRPHEKGTQFDLHTTVEAAGEPVWTEASTYLRRDGGGEKSSKKEARPGLPEARWQAPSDIGRRYGAVSGDRNPIHLHPVTARAFGFRRPIAHGMWTKARCVAALEARLPSAVTVDVTFKLPVLLPATLGFTSSHQDQSWSFAVFGEKDGKPHLAGTAEPNED